MKYIIMLTLVIGLALADWVTGFIKAFVNNNIQSVKMRNGGMKKLGEIVVQLVGIGIDIAIRQLIVYYPDAEQLGAITSNVTAILVCCFISIMELISIFENFASIHPEAKWATMIAKKLTNIEYQKEVKPHDND